MAIGKCKKKIETKLIEKPSARMTCFSKRGTGLFKKAEELHVLSGAKIGVLAFSKGGKIYCYDAKTLDHLIFPPQSDISTAEEAIEDDWESALAQATANLLLRPESDISVENEVEVNTAESDLAEEFCSCDVQTLDYLHFTQLNIALEKDVEKCWEFKILLKPWMEWIWLSGLAEVTSKPWALRNSSVWRGPF